MKEIFEKLLAYFAKKIIAKYKPKVIGITGSIGKTSTKEAVFAVASSKFHTRTNIKNYNNEFGLPLSIIGEESPKRNPLKWIYVFCKAFWMTYAFVEYPKVLVLEMGVDKPGDMDHLVEIVNPDIAVLTSIGISHLKNFGSQQGILNEKSKIFKNFDKENTAVLNVDDSMTKALIAKINSSVLTYGFDSAADVCVLDYKSVYSKNENIFGTLFKLSYKGAVLPVEIKNVIGAPHVQACAAAAAVGLSLGINLHDIGQALANYKPQPGRLRVIEGIRDSYIIDDTYNAAPQSIEAALKELFDFPVAHKVAVLGDMLELGNLSDSSHQNIGKALLEYHVDYAILVGPQMKLAYNELLNSSFPPDRVFHFMESADAINKTKEIILSASAVLVKGSQGMRMEKITKAIMAHPEKAEKLLCRQEPYWLK